MIRPDSPEVPKRRCVPPAAIINKAKCDCPERGSLKKRFLEEDLQLDEFNDRLAQQGSPKSHRTDKAAHRAMGGLWPGLLDMARLPRRRGRRSAMLVS